MLDNFVSCDWLGCGRLVGYVVWVWVFIVGRLEYYGFEFVFLSLDIYGFDGRFV